MTGRGYDFWLLDLDGTLVDIEEEYVHEILHTIGDRFGVGFSDWETEMLWYGPSQPRASILDRHDLDPQSFWEAFHELEEPESRAAATHLYADAESFVPAIDQPVGLVTHCQEYLTNPILDSLDITDWFDTVVCCTDETGWKPDPTPVELAMSDIAVGNDRERGALVGDDPGDVGAAWNAGLSGIHVRRRDPDRVGHCVLGDKRVRSLDELQDTVF